MVTSIAVKMALQEIALNLAKFNLVTTKNKDGNDVHRTVYDPELSFGRTLSKSRLFAESKMNDTLDDKHLSSAGKTWSLMSWNRGSLGLNESYNLKPFNFVSPIKDDNNTYATYKARMVELPLTIKLYSNSGEMIEDIEEFAIAIYSENKQYSVAVPHFGNMDVIQSSFQSNGIEKLDTKSKGSVFAYSFVVTLRFFVLVGELVDVPAIKKIFMNVNVGDKIEYVFDLRIEKNVETGVMTTTQQE
jgi:hypothetical protein